MDKQKIGSLFSKAALRYDKYAWFPQRASKRLLGFMPSSLRRPMNILDIGCGTGAMVVNLSRRFKRARVIGLDLAYGMLRVAAGRKDRNGEVFLQADLDRLPFKNGMFEMVTSNLVYQRVSNLNRALKKVNRILIPGGRLYISLAVDGTLRELQTSFVSAYRKIIKSSPKEVYRHPLPHRVIKSLEDSGFKIIRTAAFRKQKYYNRAAEIIKWLKSIGANYYYHQWMNGLGSRQVLGEMEKIYRARYCRKGRIYATFCGLIIEAIKQ